MYNNSIYHDHDVQGGNDPQTEADRKAERCIVASLSKRFPEINIQGEEVSLSLKRFHGGEDIA